VFALYAASIFFDQQLLIEWPASRFENYQAHLTCALTAIVCAERPISFETTK
jgi:hypothetical protein